MPKLTLPGPFGETYGIASAFEDRGSSDELFSARDSELLERLLLRYVEDPHQRDALRDALGAEYDGPLEGRRFVAEVALRIARGELLFQYLRDVPRGGILPGVTVLGSGEIIEAASTTRDEEDLIRDWRIECHHHTTAAARQLFERGTRVGVVPDKGSVEDLVKIHYKDEYQTPPPALQSNAGDIPKSGSSGGYDVYDLNARYDGDIEQYNFLRSAFWSAYLDKTSYNVRGTPSAITVDVYNPRQYKFEFKFPPLGKVKAGAKLQKDIERSGRGFATPGKVKESWSIEAAGWSPSALTLDTFEAKSGEPSKSESKKALLESVAFSVDDDTQEIKVIEYVAALLNFYTECMGIVDAIKENAPQVGWYIDFELQLMQGGVGIQWYWKEHTDERVFQFIDFNVELKIVSITFELGIGISGLGFKAQVFAQLTGELSISANAQRDDPDGPPGFAIPTKGTIKGALGARFEAGNLFKAEGKGVTGIELTVELGINRGRSKMVHLDGYANWTGIAVEATVSGGLFGLGRTRKWERTLVQPTRLGGFQWPKPEPFSPPYLSRGRIENVIEGVITSGLNVRVIRSVSGMFNDVHWTPSQIASALADQIDRHTSFHRTSKMVDGLAHAIRKDLDQLGSSWGRDWIEEADFLGYVRGSKLQAHLDAMVNPAAEMAAAAGA